MIYKQHYETVNAALKLFAKNKNEIAPIENCYDDIKQIENFRQLNLLRFKTTM